MALTATHASNWHPLTWLSYLLDYQLYGLHPWGYHRTNLLLHAANGVLLFLVFRRMTGAVWRSALVAALFAWHPLHVESVAWIAERKDVLSTFFGLLTIAAYAHYAGRPGWLRYVAVLLLYALALMAKPMLVTIPCVLLLLDYWPLGRWQGWSVAETLRLGWHALKSAKGVTRDATPFADSGRAEPAGWWSRRCPCSCCPRSRVC